MGLGQQDLEPVARCVLHNLLPKYPSRSSVFQSAKLLRKITARRRSNGPKRCICWIRASSWSHAGVRGVLQIATSLILVEHFPETGFADWDRVTLKTLAPVIHPIHRTRPSSSLNHLVSTLTNLAYQCTPSARATTASASWAVGLSPSFFLLPYLCDIHEPLDNPSILAAAAEKGIEITKSLIEPAKIEGNLTKDITMCVSVLCALSLSQIILTQIWLAYP